MSPPPSPMPVNPAAPANALVPWALHHSDGIKAPPVPSQEYLLPSFLPYFPFPLLLSNRPIRTPLPT